MKHLLLFTCGVAAAVALPWLVSFLRVAWDVFKPARRRPRRIY